MITFAPLNIHQCIYGVVLEWLKRHAWKACIRQKRIGGSNPPHSANSKYISAVNQIFAADIIFNTYKYPYNL